MSVATLTFGLYISPQLLPKMQPNLYQYITISRSKEYILKVSEYGKKIHATVKLPPLRVIRAQLDVDGNGFGHHTVTLERPPWVKEFCDKAMRLAFKDTRLWPELDRIDEESFVQGAAHSLLRNGLFLKKRMWEKTGGKMTQPKFRNPSGERIESEIHPGAVLEVSFQFFGYCIDGKYGLGGNIQDCIIVHEAGNGGPDVPYIEF